MAGQLITLKNLISTYVVESSPSTNYGTQTRLTLRNGSGNNCDGLITWPLPAPLLTKYSTGRYKVVQTKAMVGTITLRVFALTGTWSQLGAKWSNKPANNAATVIAITKVNPPAGTVWDFDISAILNAASNGTAWRGITLTVQTTTGTMQFYNERSASAMNHSVEVTWSTAPEKPTQLNPSGGKAISVPDPTLTTDFIDRNGTSAMAAMQVQLNDIVDFTSPDYDSGTYLTTVPQFDLSSTLRTITNKALTSNVATLTTSAAHGFTTGWAIKVAGVGAPFDGEYTVTGTPTSTTFTYAKVSADVASAAATGVVTWKDIVIASANYWRARVMDGDNNWSEYSEPALFTRVVKGSVTITQPTATVSDSSPRIIWSTAGMTQKSWQVLFYSGTTLLHDSGKITSTETSYTPPLPILNLQGGHVYKVVVLVWDTVDRATLIDDLPYVSDEQEFTYVFDGSTPPVTSLVREILYPMPWIKFTWQRASLPDFFEVWRGTEIVAVLDPSDVFVSGTTYEYIDKMAAPRTEHVWKIVAKENDLSSLANPTITETITPDTAWICSRTNDDLAIPLLNYVPNLSLDDGTSSIDILDSEEAILVYQNLKGWAGGFSGVISGAIGSKTSDEYLADFEQIREEQGMPMVLSYANQSVPCLIYKLTYTMTVFKEEIAYLVSFSVSQRKALV